MSLYLPTEFADEYRRASFVCVLSHCQGIHLMIDLSDILPTSYHAVVDTGVEKGDVVGIWG